MMEPGHTDHSKCPKFTMSELSGGIISMEVCWDQTNIREIAKTLRQVADGLDEMPADTTGIGVKPL